MKPKLVFVVIICVFTICSFVCLSPSILSINVAASTENEKQINDLFELEPENEEVSTTPKIIVEKLNWFSVVNTMFEKFTNAKVIDCYSKKSYIVRRCGGYNHADVEALTSTDTAIFKSIYGGTWSWTRRPVWVEIDGVWVAGSINGMPHSYSYITDNNEDGHTCIHFLNSRTHGTDNLDPDHQKAVSYAYEHGDEINDIVWKHQ